MIEKPFCQACENNKAPILTVLQKYFAGIDLVLEIGSGTGQHAIHFAQHLPHLQWQTSDRPQNHSGIQAWLDEAALPNVRSAIALDVNHPWPVAEVPAIFSANTLHIMSWAEVEKLFQGIGRHLAPGGLLCLYGPFNYNGTYTSPGNASFDRSLRAGNSPMGIRDFEAVGALAEAQGLVLLEDVAMPANNRCLIWRRS